MNTNLQERKPWDGLPVELPLVRLRELKKTLGLANTTIYELMEANLFPRPVKIGPRAVAWPKAHIDAWLADRAAKSQPAPAPRRRMII